MPFGFITITGLPLTKRLNFVESLQSTVKRKCKTTSVKSGTTPCKTGTEISAMGMVARSAIIKVRTSSNGCICPSCLFPISR